MNEDWVPRLPSRDVELLRALPPHDADTWASRALRTVLESVGNDRQRVLMYPIAVIDAWTENDAALCVVYTPPLGVDLVGHRRQRGDTRPDPWLLLDPEAPDYARYGFDPAIGLATPAAADEYGWQVCDDIGDSLGIFGKHLRYDGDGLGWWGTLDDTLPVRPARAT